MRQPFLHPLTLGDVSDDRGELGTLVRLDGLDAGRHGHPPPVFVGDHALLVIIGPAIESPTQAANNLLCGADPTAFYALCRSLPLQQRPHPGDRSVENKARVPYRTRALFHLNRCRRMEGTYEAAAPR